MENIFLYNKVGAITGRKLAYELNLTPVVDTNVKRNHNPVIRWGSSIPLPNDRCNLNNYKAIKIASNSLYTFEKLNEHGILVPKYWVTSSIDYLPDIKLLARKFYHRAGLDIIECNTKDHVLGALQLGRIFFVEFIPTSIELRVHVINRKVVKVFEKYKDGSDAHDYIRTSKFGWRFRRVNFSEHYPEIIPVAVKTLDALGLVFGALDMALTKENKWAVWEVNTAPGLNNNTLRIYKEELSKLI